MKPVSGADVQIIAIATCSLFVIGIGIWGTLLSINAKLKLLLDEKK